MAVIVPIGKHMFGPLIGRTEIDVACHKGHVGTGHKSIYAICIL